MRGLTMRKMTSAVLFGAGLLGAGGMAPARLPAAPAFYTEAQAEQGAAIYGERCAMCHGAMLEGTYETPALTGKFVANWAGRPVGDLYDYLGRAMPQFAPGSLSGEDNARVLAYLLKANGYRAGQTALPADGAGLHRAMLPAPGPAR